jgi:hypothetical protein
LAFKFNLRRYNEDIGKNDEKIGTVVVPLSGLEPSECRVFEMQPLDMTGLDHAFRKEVVAVPPTLRFEAGAYTRPLLSST